ERSLVLILGSIVPDLSTRRQVGCRQLLRHPHRVESRLARLHPRRAGDRLGVAGEEPTLKRLLGPRELDGKLNRVLRRADLARDLVLLTVPVRVVGPLYLAVVADREFQGARAPAVVVELVRAVEVSRLEGRADYRRGA